MMLKVRQPQGARASAPRTGSSRTFTGHRPEAWPRRVHLTMGFPRGTPSFAHDHRLQLRRYPASHPVGIPIARCCLLV